MARIGIIGGHGKIALLAAPLIAEGGDTVVSFIRDPKQSADIEAAGATPVVADVEQLSVDEIADLIHGLDAVVWSAGAGGGSPERTYAVDRDAAIRSIDAAVQAGVRRYVMVSYFGAGPEHGVPSDDSFFAYAESKAAADTHLRASSLDFTILGPSGLTDGDATGTIQTAPAAKKATVSRANVAQVIARTLQEPATVGRTIEFDDGETPIAEALR